MHPRVAFDWRLRLFEVSRFQRRADPVQDFRQMIGELIVRQLVGLDEASVAEHRIHPFFGQCGALPDAETRQNCKAALLACQS